MEWPTQIINPNKMFRGFSNSLSENKLFDGRLNNKKLSNNQTYVGVYW